MIKQAKKQNPFLVLRHALLQHMAKRAGLALLLMAGSFALGVLSLAVPAGGVITVLLRLVQLLGFIAAGAGYVWYWEKKKAGPAFEGERLMYVLLLTLVVAATLLLLYGFSKNGVMIIAVSSACAFLLPFVSYEAWCFYKKIPAPQYLAWYNPDTANNCYSLPSSRRLDLRLKLSLRYYDLSERVFIVPVSGRLKLGLALHYFLLEYNKTAGDAAIETTDKLNQPYGWEFREEIVGGLLKRHLNPGLSLQENNIRENAVILIRRLPNPITAKTAIYEA